MRFPPWSCALIAICIVVAAVTRLGDANDMVALFTIAPGKGQGLNAVMEGEAWRLLSPAFLHFGPMHLIFNMMWLWDLGGLLERRYGARFLLSFVGFCAIAANLAQYALTGSPWFGGMSGVVYGFLGYCWIDGRNNPQAGYTLNQQTVIFMLGWYVACWTGILGAVANWAHTAGLLTGMVWAFADVQQRKAAAK